MPMRDLSFAPTENLLSAGELEIVVQAAVRIGFNKVRFTGGEPTLREDLVEIVERTRRIEGINDISMTTNAMLLPGLAEPLKRAGLDRINVHLDSLDEKRLHRVMRFSSLQRVLEGIESAEKAGLTPIKLNVVVVRDYNDGDVADLAALTLDRTWHVRFIELMPLGNGPCAQLSLSQFVPTLETRERIEKVHGRLEPIDHPQTSDESRNYRFSNGKGIVGFISPVSEPYCGHCNRMRLTADGKFHLCLLHDEELDVRAALRNGGGLDSVEQILIKAVQAKPIGHSLDDGISTKQRAMFQIGG